MLDSAAVATDLDAAHARAKAAYKAKDFGGFMAIFAPDLRYRQPDGRTIGWEQLAHDVGTQLMMVEEVDTTYVRESLDVHGDNADEVISQTASLVMRHWLFFKRTWHLSRRARYRWGQSPEGWKVQEVEVLSESVRRG